MFVSVYRLVVQCDDQSNVYVDGVYVGSTNYYQDVGYFTVPKSTRVIAIEGHDKYNLIHGFMYDEDSWWENSFAIIAALNNTFRTGSHWYCSAVWEVNWTEADFNLTDSWQPARHMIGIDKTYVPQELKPSDWIWGEAQNPIYCRGIFSKFS